MRIDAISYKNSFVSSVGNTPKSNNTSDVIAQAKESMQKKAQKELAAIYEKTSDKDHEMAAKAPYTINRMSKEDRDALVSKMKADLEERQNQMQGIVERMMGKQVQAVGKADESMWQFLSKGNFTVDAATKAQAERDISEDGYWGVKQTSQRLFDFASALAGDDKEKMKTMQNAMERGFDKAKRTWGKELPKLSQDTMAAANELFANYFAEE